MQKVLNRWLAVAVMAVASAAQANTYVVTKTVDTADGVCDDDCSLREAVQAANLHHGGDTIILPAGRYQLTIPDNGEDDAATGDLDIKGRITLLGAGIDATIIDGHSVDRFGRNLDRVLEVAAGAEFKAYALTITGNYNEGAILNKGTSRLTRVKFARGGYYYGIFNAGDLTVESGEFLNESSYGVVSNAGVLHLRRSALRGWSLNNSGSAVVEQCLFTGTKRAITNSGVLELSNSTVSGNKSYYYPYARDQDVVPRADAAGVVSNEVGGTATLSFVTITENIGGGLNNKGTLTLAGSLIAGNSTATVADDPSEGDPIGTDENGDPVYFQPEIDFEFGDDCVNFSGSVTARNSLLGGPDCHGPAAFHDAGGNIFHGEGPTSALLFPLQLNGGSRETHKPRKGSVIVDAITPFSAPDACPAVDQRGVARPPNDDGRRGQYCDIGAYELAQ